MITKLDNMAKFFAGRTPLPAGAVPLAGEDDKISSCICLTPPGRWVRWWSGTRSIESLPPSTQRDVIAVLVEQLGGTSAAAANTLGISARTVEAWRSGKAPLPIKAAYMIAETIATD